MRGERTRYCCLFKIPETVKGALQPEVRSVALSPDMKSILVGTSGGEIYELTTKDAKVTPNSKFLPSQVPDEESLLSEQEIPQ